MPNIIDIEIGKRLQFEREKRGFSPVEMANYLQISEKEYNDREDGRVSITIDEIALLKEIGVDSDYLCNGQIELDFCIERCLKIMPDDVYKETTNQLLDIVRNHKAGDDMTPLYNFLMDLRNYITNNLSAKPLREVEKCMIFTTLYESAKIPNSTRE